jgi:hypothetical protein
MSASELRKVADRNQKKNAAPAGEFSAKNEPDDLEESAKKFGMSPAALREIANRNRNRS